MTRPKRFIREACKASNHSDEKCTFLVGAAVVLGSRVIATGACTTKTHPKNPKLNVMTKRKQLCAEVVALIKALKIIPIRKLKECSIYVARQRQDGSLAMAKPCEHCQKLFRKFGIKNIFYTNAFGEVEKLNLNLAFLY